MHRMAICKFTIYVSYMFSFQPSLKSWNRTINLQPDRLSGNIGAFAEQKHVHVRLWKDFIGIIDTPEISKLFLYLFTYCMLCW